MPYSCQERGLHNGCVEFSRHRLSLKVPEWIKSHLGFLSSRKPLHGRKNPTLSLTLWLEKSMQSVQNEWPAWLADHTLCAQVDFLWNLVVDKQRLAHRPGEAKVKAMFATRPFSNKNIWVACTITTLQIAIRFPPLLRVSFLKFPRRQQKRFSTLEVLACKPRPAAFVWPSTDTHVTIFW